ncbi:MAG: redox-sensing transcriptional repressor Rex [Candidatus Omnitrophota bacterium]
MKIPPPIIPRISIYYRALLSQRGPGSISSEELSSITGCSAAQIRKDLTYFGQFGTPGRGYQVEGLKQKLSEILGKDKAWDVALIGAGNLGSALLAYKGFKNQGFNIRYAFDNDKKKINKTHQGIRIRDISDLKSAVRSNKIDIAIVAVPQEDAQRVIDILVNAGIKAILNFAPIRPKAQPSVQLLNIDLSIELEKLTHFLKTA